MRHPRLAAAALLVAVTTAATIASAQEPTELRRLPLAEYRDRMIAGWIGQMVGVGWGAPTEFKFRGRILPEDAVPVWKPGMVNQFDQDDLYVEMTFLRTLEEHGFDVSGRRAGIDFANAEYKVWHANRGGRDNLRAGIAPPDSGHPSYTRHADCIDYQIEADYSGLIAPGLPNTVIELGELFGRVMNYGDGVYAGQFVGGMYAEAFFEEDPLKLVEAGLRCIPPESEYARCIRDVIAWHSGTPDDWEATWHRIEAKWNLDRDHRKFSCTTDDLNIDAKLNGAYIVMGLLYGERDPEKTLLISMRCGQDSDCNPSNAAGVLFTTLGFEALPARYHSALDSGKRFSFTAYDFDALIATCEKLARVAVGRAGGRIERDADGTETMVIPVVAPRPSPLLQCWTPGPVAGVRFTAEELKEIPPLGGVDFSEVIEKFAPDWEVLHCGPHDEPGLRGSWGGRERVLVTHPWSDSVGCTLRRRVAIPATGRTTLRLSVGRDPRGSWDLLVRADGVEIHRVSVDERGAPQRWLEVEVELSAFASHSIELELVNQASEWRWETGYWHGLEIVTD